MKLIRFSNEPTITSSVEVSLGNDGQNNSASLIKEDTDLTSKNTDEAKGEENDINQRRS